MLALASCSVELACHGIERVLSAVVMTTALRTSQGSHQSKGAAKVTCKADALVCVPTKAQTEVMVPPKQGHKRLKQM